MARAATLVVPNYNGGRFLEANLRSLVAQDYPSFEVVLLDNVSTDDSVAIARAIDHPRLRIIEATEHLDMIGNFDRAIRMVETPYFAICASDELYEPQWLSAMVKLLDDNPAAFCATCKADSVDPEGRLYLAPEERYKHSFWPEDEPAIFEPSAQLRKLQLGCWPVFTVCLHRKTCFDQVWVYDVRDLKMAGDWAYFFRGFHAGYTLAGTHRPLAHYRRHPGMATKMYDNTLQRFTDERDVLAWMGAEIGAAPDYRLVRRTALNHFAMALAKGDTPFAARLVDFVAELGDLPSVAQAALMRVALLLGPHFGKLMLLARDQLLAMGERANSPA